jgi:hypothetical protein
MIPEQFTETRKLYERYKDFIELLPPDYYENLILLNLDDTLKDPKTGENWIDILNSSFNNEYDLYTCKSIYFKGCGYAIYEKTYSERLKKYCERLSAKESHFIKSEYETIKNIKPFHFGDKEHLTSLNIATERIKEFLTSKAEALGFEVESSNSVDEINTTIPELAPTVFGDYNYQLLHDMYEGLNDFLPSNITKDDFAKAFLVTDKTPDKIDFIGANVSTFAYFITKLHPYFNTDLRNKSIYNQWWADRFSFKGSNRDKKGISNMCSALKKGDKFPDKKGTIDEVVSLLTQNHN